MKANILEIAIETPKDGNLFFPKAGVLLRGRKDFMRIAKHQPDAVKLANDFSRGVPGTIVRIDLDEKTVTLVEPLRSEEWLSEREEIESRGIEIPHTSELTAQHIPDWLHEIKRSLDNGYAKILSGKMPDDLGEESKGAPRSEDKSEDRIDRLCDLVETLLTALVPAGAK